MPDTPLSLFISYSRTDSAFVDRLEADLKARNFQPWVDRRKLEGGQDWSAELQKAIENCQLMLVVLSPEAMASKYVRREYRYADSQDKPIIPLNWRPTKVPFELNDIQWVNFVGNYNQGLADLLVALSRQAIAAMPPPKPHSVAAPPSIRDEELPVLVPPQPASPLPAADLNQLYRAGVAAKARNDLERTAIFWKQVLDRDPAFGNGTLTPQMQQLQAELHPIRVQRLRDQAEQAHRAGVWGQEIGAWQALLGLEPGDEQAKKRLPVAEQNLKYAWIYDNAQEFASEKEIPALKTQLELLWRDAPYYGDPAGIAKLAGLKAPPGFEQTMTAQSRKRAEEEEARGRAASASERRQRRREFVTSPRGLNSKNSGSIWLGSLCLLGGVGVSIGALSQSWVLAVGVAAALALLAYPLGVHRAVGLLEVCLMFLMNAVLVVVATWLFSLLNYDELHPSQLWLFGINSTVTIGHQIIFGVILGAVLGGLVFLIGAVGDAADSEGLYVIFMMILFGSPVIWLVFMLLGAACNWGYGFGYGWVYALLETFIAVAGVAGLFMGGVLSTKASGNSPAEIHDVEEERKTRDKRREEERKTREGGWRRESF